MVKKVKESKLLVILNNYQENHPGTAAMGETITDNENTDNK